MEPHEVAFFEQFAALGEQARLIQRSEARLPTNDFSWAGLGVEIELKRIWTANYSNASSLIQRAVSKARAHGFVKENFIIDLGDRMLTGKLHDQLSQYNIRNPENRIRALWVMTKRSLVKITLLDQE